MDVLGRLSGDEAADVITQPDRDRADADRQRVDRLTKRTDTTHDAPGIAHNRTVAS